ncbi:hypothetical protein SUGI_0695710 [Cryptomeria japonica]|nr:hypothetical protein SUGI_0695710 [Cryptomeria japonica]
MGRKNKWESLIKLDVQDISNEGNNFSSEDLERTPIGDDNNRHIDLCAAIPFERLSHFVQGEGLLDDTETQFVIKKHKVYNLTEPNDHATKMYLSYHCAYGPEDRRNKRENNLEKMQRIRRFTQKRGCQAHFYVKVMYGRPNVAIITYNEFSHQDANGEFCHGKDDPSGDPRSSAALRLSNECKSYIESLLLMGVSIDTICEQHYLDRGLTKLMNKRDTYLLRKDVLNAWKRVRSLRSQKNEDDAKSVCLWHEEEKDNFFYYKTPNNEENVPFIIGIQTPWMREMMVKHSHNSIIAMDSTFSTNKYGYQLYSLLVFDEQEAGVPVAWAISSRNKVEDINEWLMEVYKRGKQDKEDWHVNAFMTDDASAEIEAIRLSFDCQVLLCIWHVRRAWLKKVYRYVSNKDVATHIFDRLGEIMYEISDDQGITTQSIKNFMEEFKEEKKFIDYFQNTWCHDESRLDDVTPLVDDIDEVRGNSSHEIDIIDGCIPSEDQDVHGVVVGEAQRTDGWISSNTSNDGFQSSIDYLNSLLQNLPTSEDEKNIFSQCVERFRKDINASLASSSKFRSIPGSENMSIRRISPWFSPTKMHKRHSIHQRRNAISENLNERVEEHETFLFPSTRCRKQKKKKVTNRSGIAIQEERDIIMQQGLNDQESTRRRRLPFSIDLNQMLTDEIQAVDTLEDHQKNQEYMVPISVDPEKTTTTIVDAMQARDGNEIVK